MENEVQDVPPNRGNPCCFRIGDFPPENMGIHAVFGAKLVKIRIPGQRNLEIHVFPCNYMEIHHFGIILVSFRVVKPTCHTQNFTRIHVEPSKVVI